MAVSRVAVSLFDSGWSPILPVCRAERASARPEPREPCIKAAGGGCRIPTGTAGRTQQRIVASRENRKFSQQRRNTTVRTHGNHAAHSHIHVSARLFPVPLVRQNFGSVPFLYVQTTDLLSPRSRQPCASEAHDNYWAKQGKRDE